MAPGILKIVIKSVVFYKKPVFYQILVIALLSAVITGSLLTGKSVRTSLKNSASERLGNTGFVISSGVRYVDASLTERFKKITGINCTGLLEMNGYSQGMISQKGAFNTHIYGINSDFFKFHGNDTITIKPGEVAVNNRLANYLGVKPGDELIIRFNAISDIPADSPFAPAKGTGASVVMRVGTILEPFNIGNFSLSISQIMPMNVFLNLSDLVDINVKQVKINRLLIDSKNDFSAIDIYNNLKKVLKPSDVGLSLRNVNKTSGIELISDRIFIDELLIKEVQNVLPSSAPVLTYLANRLKSGTRSTPYSFVSALPSSIYPDITQDNGIIINRWLADDLVISEGDTVKLFWYSPDLLNKLIETSEKFVVKRIVDMGGIWSDSLLMPAFPGISGSESCTDWDAGVPVKMEDIRRTDEDYWNKFRGTPKAFINYEKGKMIWGSNFGPATALRFPEGVSNDEIERKLSGSIEPDHAGLNVTDLSGESLKAANESVDFSTLFLSLGFFLILASVVLLSLAVSSYFDTKRDQIKIFFSLGFKKRWIEQVFYIESGLISLTGCIIGSFAGFLVNILITRALNSVWRGAVQTNTLETFFTFMPVLIGFLITILIVMVFMVMKIKRFLKSLNRKEKEIQESNTPRRNYYFLLTSFTTAIVVFALSVFFQEHEISLSFAAGTILLISIVLSWRQYYIGSLTQYSSTMKIRKSFSRLYYAFYPSYAVTPILFIAAGIFAVFITGANKMDFNDKALNRSGGTGGYLLWCENTIPLKEDLSTIPGRKTMGFDDQQLAEMRFVQAKRSQGDDASCLNLNHVTTPPLLGIDPVDFIAKGAFSFSRILINKNVENPWQYLNIASENNTIYGIADQTVLQWGLKIKTGDTLIIRAENGQPLNIIIAAGLKSSVFQGYVLIGSENFTKYYPSVSGSSVLLVDGNPEFTGVYKRALNERLENYGANIEPTTDRLASFYVVTNTYLSVFGVFGAFGMITGIVGLGFVLLRNYNQRKREFALMLATGFSVKKIRGMILSEQVLILFAGVTSGVVSAIVATLPSLTSNPEIPWLLLSLMVFSIIITGLIALLISVRAVTNDSLTASLKKE
jgi:putative ABC transport system permease protein